MRFKRLIACAMVGLFLLAPAAYAWKKHGVAGGGGGYDFTVDFNTAALGRWTDAKINTVFNNAAVTGHYNDDDSGNPDYVWSVVDASSYPGSHGRALQSLLPYGALGESINEGCFSVNSGDTIDFGGVQIATTAFASSYTTVLTFASTAGVSNGNTVTDLNRDAMFPGTVVSSHTGTQVTLSHPIGKACISGTFGPTERWALNLADTNTINMSWQMLVVTGFDFRFIGGKIAPYLSYFLNNGSSYPAASDKLWWKASCVNTFPTTSACPAIWSAKYQGIGGSPTAQQDFSWNISTNVWHSFKFQFHRGCSIDASVLSADVIDFTGGVQIATNAPTAIGNPTLHFASGSTTGVVDGHVVSDTTTTGSIPPGTIVSSHTSTTVTLSANVGCVDHSYINIWGPTSDSDDTPFLWLTYNPLTGEPNYDTSTNYFPSLIMSTWYGGNQPDNSCATVAGCAVLYDNIRIWSGTGP